ncbi:hypothetical protein LZ32DRAFT_111314 [Colletotrichum eremochloae]|nr:hypothetical protein LZ32DRAFT_111314 [Colletotrichum eremochloae]
MYHVQYFGPTFCVAQSPGSRASSIVHVAQPPIRTSGWAWPDGPLSGVTCMTGCTRGATRTTNTLRRYSCTPSVAAWTRHRPHGAAVTSCGPMRPAAGSASIRLLLPPKLSTAAICPSPAPVSPGHTVSSRFLRLSRLRFEGNSEIVFAFFFFFFLYPHRRGHYLAGMHLRCLGIHEYHLQSVMLVPVDKHPISLDPSSHLMRQSGGTTVGISPCGK